MRLTRRKKYRGGIPHKYWSIATRKEIEEKLKQYGQSDTNCTKEELVQRLGEIEDKEASKMKCVFIYSDGIYEATAPDMESAIYTIEQYKEIDEKFGDRHEYTVEDGECEEVDLI